jgi:hypothetical protein
MAKAVLIVDIVSRFTTVFVTAAFLGGHLTIEVRNQALFSAQTQCR